MRLQHILAAADDSDEGRNAIRAAAQLRARAGARLTVLSVAEVIEGDGMGFRLLAGLRATVEGLLGPLGPQTPIELALAFGLPGIEIVRYAEGNGVDLIVVGRKRRTSIQRLLIGDTADAVARRSGIPCLFVPVGETRFDRVLAALDGSERGMAVLVSAVDFARDIQARLRVMTVEPNFDDESPGPLLHTSKSERLAQAVGRLLARSGQGESAGDVAGASPAGPLVIHRGGVVEEILSEVRRVGTDVLVLGYHRGGPAGVIEAGSIARRLAHEVPAAVLTVPL